MSLFNAQLNPNAAEECVRKGMRYEIDASCRFWWTAAVDEACFGSGRMSDLSVAGVSVTTPMLPVIGSAIMLEIDLPRASANGSHADAFLLFAAEGKVLRHHAGGDGFAAQITHASFVSQDEGG